MTPPPLQFGDALPGRDYRLRHTAFGVAVHDGKVACVLIDRGAASYHDLPGGAVDAGEDEAAALVREFREETGLAVAAGPLLARAAQRQLKSNGEPVNNCGGFYVVEVLGEDPAAKVEDDHALVWLTPAEALVKLRAEAHAWAVAAWLRRSR